MKSELLVFIIVVIVAVIPLVQISTSKTGMQAVGGYTLADYPFMFFEGKNFTAVISKNLTRDQGETLATNLFITQLPEQYRLLISAGIGDGPGDGYSQVRAFEQELKGKVIAGPYEHWRKDGIIIGTPCRNPIVAELLKIDDCETYFKPGYGMVKLVEAFGNKYLVVTGYNGDDVLRAAVYFMAMAQLRKLEGTELRIDAYTKQLPIRYGMPIGGPSEQIYRGQAYVAPY